MNKFWTELRRRNVLRVAGVYGVVGWVLAQAAALLEPALSLPLWFDTLVVTLLLLGFPVALVLSWAFELTPEGIKRTMDAPDHAPPNRSLDFAIVGGLVLVAGMMVFMPTPERVVSAQAEPAAAISPASIAVLPFADLSPAGDQVYFSDGIAEEILNVLAHTDGLKVASRTSAFQYRKNTLGIPAIAKALNVRHILEGSVRKAGDTVRITAQLIDAQGDVHLWSQTYDRPMTTETIFAIQDEIAKAIVDKMNEVIGTAGVPIAVATRKADTESVDAYALYLKGWGLFLRRGKENLAEAARVLERATVLDPEFARAWEALSVVYSITRGWGNNDRDYRALTLEAVARALQLNPKLSLPLTARGSATQAIISTDASATWEASFADFDLAIKRDPKNATALLWRGINYMTLGYFDLAERDLLQCRNVDPAYENCRRWMAMLRLDQGRNEEAFALYEAGLKKGYFNRNAQFAQAYAARGNKEMALALLVPHFSEVPNLIEPIFRSLTDPAFTASERTDAIATLDSLSAQVTYEADARLLLRDYDHIPIADSDAHYWWTQSDPVFLQSAARKRLMRAWKLPEYWRKHGFPPQCRAVGADDFECD